MTQSDAVYPLVLEPILKEKVWGGRRLEGFGKQLPAGKAIGESWELADMAETSASGGGGGPAHCMIASGPMKGRTVRDAVNAWGARLLGSAKPTSTGGFPLLVKFLDARENLSIQVHPSPAYAAEHRDAHLKTECWYIMAAEPGAVLYKGIRAGVTPDAFRRHIETGEVVGDMIAVPAVVGECHNLPSGTCHALGAGILVAEIQTPSDTTFRVYDWGRVGRELHVEQAMACIDFGPAPEATRVPDGSPRGRLVTTEFFAVDGVKLLDGESTPLVFGGRFGGKGRERAVVVMVLAGAAELAWAGGVVEVGCGRTALVPAEIAGAVMIRARGGVEAMVGCV